MLRTMNPTPQDTDEADMLKTELTRKSDECAEVSFVLSEKQRELAAAKDRLEQLERRCAGLEEENRQTAQLERVKI